MPEWIEIAEFARLIARHEGQVRRRCQRWEAEGKARKGRNADGRLQWFIRADVQGDVHQKLDVNALTPRQRIAILKRELVRDWQSARAAATTSGSSVAAAMEKIIAASRPRSTLRTLYRWTAAYERIGISGLVDDRWRIGVKLNSARTNVDGTETASASAAPSSTIAPQPSALPSAAIGTTINVHAGAIVIALPAFGGTGQPTLKAVSNAIREAFNGKKN